jgi:hypothetical protein
LFVCLIKREERKEAKERRDTILLRLTVYVILFLEDPIRNLFTLKFSEVNNYFFGMPYFKEILKKYF